MCERGAFVLLIWYKKWNKVEIAWEKEQGQKFDQNRKRRHTRMRWQHEKPRLSELIHMSSSCLTLSLPSTFSILYILCLCTFHWKFIDKSKGVKEQKHKPPTYTQYLVHMAWETHRKKDTKLIFYFCFGACTYTIFFISLLHFVGFNNAFLCNFDGDGMKNVYTVHAHSLWSPCICLRVWSCDDSIRCNTKNQTM